MSTHKYLDTTGLGQVWSKIKALITQSDWEEDDSSNNSYVQNRPAIRAGEGEGSIVEGQIEQEDSYNTYTILVSGEANATSYTFTTTDNVTSNYWLYVAEYNNDYYAVMEFSGEPTTNVITFHKTLSTETALTNEPILLHYKRKDAVGENSSAEGRLTWSIGADSHAEGYLTRAIGANGSHAEGFRTQSKGASAHAEGVVSLSLNTASHSEGSFTVAKNKYSHAEGWYTIASSNSQHVQGKYNIEDSTNTYAHIVGNGTSLSARSNAHTLDWSGNGWYAGKLTVGTGPVNDMDVSTKKYVDDSISGFSTNLSGLSDTTISSPTNNQILQYNSTTSKWENSTLPSNASNVFVVNFRSRDYDSSTEHYNFIADKTFEEIKNAYDAGKICYGLCTTLDTTSANKRALFVLSYIDDVAPIQCYFTSIKGSDTSLNIVYSLVYTTNNVYYLYKNSFDNYLIEASKTSIAIVNYDIDRYSSTWKTANNNYEKDDLFWKDSTFSLSGGGLVKATTAITSGTKINSSNTVRTTVANELKDKQPKRLVVTVTSTYDETTDENTYSADKTFTEVQTAMNEGREVYFDYGVLSNQAYYPGPEHTFICADFPGNAHEIIIYSSSSIELGYDYSYYRKADKGTIGGDLREVDEGTKIYQTAQYAHSKDDILWVMSDVGFNWDMYVAKNDIAVGDEFSTGNTGNLQAITVEDMIDMKIAASSSSVSCATMDEIEEMCSFLGFRSVTIDTSDYESINV